MLSGVYAGVFFFLRGVFSTFFFFLGLGLFDFFLVILRFFLRFHPLF